MSVSLSSGIRSALTSIQSSSSQAEVIQKRLATGKKVNSALDNPANFFTASGLKSRPRTSAVSSTASPRAPRRLKRLTRPSSL